MKYLLEYRVMFPQRSAALKADDLILTLNFVAKAAEHSFSMISRGRGLADGRTSLCIHPGKQHTGFTCALAIGIS